ncbi:hypothetical protein GCM10010981_24740 [Dyella nitratireducens]|uniref:Uncharacterized protein n=1 Tax=Dyella nitratireducens TaxID=1849580 RepID=A0ABQ1G0E4_9GAMM|nr:hypothetical protein GCM10010981_24740 [Dyella nitratireducens]GLQ40909.1 hypothetical protein GCM10007902_07590 [Dyella nitratireducens]
MPMDITLVTGRMAPIRHPFRFIDPQGSQVERRIWLDFVEGGATRICLNTGRPLTG